jgi:hypothetical protein
VISKPPRARNSPIIDRSIILRRKREEETNEKYIKVPNQMSNDQELGKPCSLITTAKSTPADAIIAQKLALRAYHLPGYSPWRDYLQYMFNNHPVLSICFQNQLHPLGIRRQLLILLGLFSFGMAITNDIYLYFVATGRDTTKEVLAVTGSAAGEGQLSLTRGALALVAAGSASHALFNRFVWVLAVCCAHRRLRSSGGRGGGRCPDLGGQLAMLVVITSAAAATCIVITRESADAGRVLVPFANGTSPTEGEVTQALPSRGLPTPAIGRS